MPRGNDELFLRLRAMTDKYKVYTDRPNRFLRISLGKVTTKCRYGFPFPMRLADSIGKDGV